LLLAAAFTLTGSDSPAVARLTTIVFHLGSVFLVTALLAQFFEAPLALLGGFTMATLPMSGFYGRMVNYEPLCLLAILVQLHGYARFKRTGRPLDLIWLSAGIIGGGLIDWPSFFFTAALALVEAVDVLRRRSSTFGLLALLVLSATSVFAFDLWHLWYAGRNSVQAFVGVLGSNRPLWEQDFTISRFVLGQIDTFRRFFTEIGLISILLVAACLARPRWPLSERLFAVANAPALKRVLIAGIGAALAYVLVAPSWSMAHQYWQFYFLPVVVTSVILLWRLLQRALSEHPTRLLVALRVVCVLDVLIASAYWLHFRHTRIEAHAVEATATFRSTYLTPESFQGANEDGRNGNDRR
jgi:hypothetical protein